LKTKFCEAVLRWFCEVLLSFVQLMDLAQYYATPVMTRSLIVISALSYVLAWGAPCTRRTCTTACATTRARARVRSGIHTAACARSELERAASAACMYPRPLVSLSAVNYYLMACPLEVMHFQIWRLVTSPFVQELHSFSTGRLMPPPACAQLGGIPHRASEQPRRIFQPR
jgi:hypothetical protein